MLEVADYRKMAQQLEDERAAYLSDESTMIEQGLPSHAAFYAETAAYLSMTSVLMDRIASLVQEAELS